MAFTVYLGFGDLSHFLAETEHILHSLATESVISTITTLQFASFNTNRLYNPVKCAAYLDLLRRHLVDVAFIQEFHLRSNNISRFSNRYYYVAASVSFTSKTRGFSGVEPSLVTNYLGKPWG